MRVPLPWLRQLCDPPLSSAEIAERLTMTGTKVEAVLHHGVPSPRHFIVGKVLAAQAHPNADRLKVCEVDVGAAEPVQIVCGAPNVAAGQAVALALPGAVMPDGTKLKAAKLRGVRSEGMILAEDELQLSGAHAGIIVLSQADLAGSPRHGHRDLLAPGTPLADLLELHADVLELEITPNRPDCLSVYGVARELHAATGAALAPAPWQADHGGAGPLQSIAVDVDCPELCPRFTARAFHDVTVGPSPLWLKARLSAAGQRPINNVVDITNYVMLLTGQPLHAFDLQKIEGARLRVRRARDGERIATLDGEVRTLDDQMVLIEDAAGPTSIAGVMGGRRSEVSPSTEQVLIEAATWEGASIHRTAGLLSLRSEASARFEKDLAPEQCLQAQALASSLLVALCKATLLPGTIDVAAPLPAPQTVALRRDRVKAILGIDVARERQVAILTSLGFSVEQADRDLVVAVPPQRRDDVSREADLIEEIARIHGLHALPATLPARRGAYGLLSAKQRLRRKLADTLTGQGFYEIYGSTFAARDSAPRLLLAPADPRRKDAVALRNPLSEDQALLRSTLLGSLLEAAARNGARGASDLKLFELGAVFLSDANAIAANGRGGVNVIERRTLGALMSGRQAPRSWRGGEPAAVDFFAMKGALEGLASALRAPVHCVAACEPEQSLPFLHPRRCAEIQIEGAQIGWIGELHPQLTQSFGLTAGGEEETASAKRVGAAAFELDAEALLDAAVATPLYEDLISFPALREDLAVVLPESIPAAQALKAVREAGSALLDRVAVFDVYSGPQIGAGKRSLALALSFKAPDRTLTDLEVAPVRAKIVAALQAIGGELRA